ncbi:hypothetical protein ACQ4PT_046387 [Festuca glaucescens]
MAAQLWKRLFWERYDDSLSFAGVARSRLADVSGDLASPLRRIGEDLASPLRRSEEERAFARISECEHKLADASMLVAFAISALGTVDIVAVRCMGSDDAAEVRARAGARAAKERASEAYDAVTSSRGHLRAARRLVTATNIGYHAVEDEREAILAAIEAATGILGMEAFRPSEDGVPDVSLPRVDSQPRSAAVTPSNLVRAEWRLLGGFLPDALLRVALSGAVREIEAALQVGADAVDKGSNVAAAIDHSAAAALDHSSAAALDHSAAAALDHSSAGADLPACYTASVHAFDAAHAELSCLLVLNTEVAIIFHRCAPYLGPDGVEKGWRLSDFMEASRADAERHGRVALDHLWTASALLEYCFLGVLAWGSASSSWEEAQKALGRALT